MVMALYTKCYDTDPKQGIASTNSLWRIPYENENVQNTPQTAQSKELEVQRNICGKLKILNVLQQLKYLVKMTFELKWSQISAFMKN